MEQVISLSLNNKHQGGCSYKVQKLGKQKETDSIFQKGDFYVMDNLLVCVTKNYYGYNDNQVKIQILEQQNNGELKLKKVVRVPENEYLTCKNSTILDLMD